MPNTSDLSAFVVAGEDVKDGEKIIFLDGGKLFTYKDGKTTIQFQVQCPNNKVKTLSLNKTSSRNLSPVYGADTEGWEGKEAIVAVAKQLVQGQMKDVMYLYPVK